MEADIRGHDMKVETRVLKAYREYPARQKSLTSLLLSCLIGAVTGFFILHPLSMTIHGHYEDPTASTASHLKEAFTPAHLPMGIFFMVLGTLGGLAQGLYLRRLGGIYQKFAELSQTDDLTSVFNRGRIMKEVEREIARTNRNGRPFSLMILDIDYFKNHNDTFGHHNGDVLLKAFVNIVNENVRSSDVVGRYGGDEFIVLMPETARDASREIGERIREQVETHPLLSQRRVAGKGVTVSAGIAEFPTEAQEMGRLFEVADAALYAAKQTGRNKVCVADKCVRKDIW